MPPSEPPHHKVVPHPLEVDLLSLVGDPVEGQQYPLQPQTLRAATQAHQFEIPAVTPGTWATLPFPSLLKV
jgi:hypothetical protein